MRRASLILLSLAGVAPGLAAQAVTASAAALLKSELASQVGVGYDAPPLGPLVVSLGAVRFGASTGDRWGAGFDLALRVGSKVRAYPVAGVAAGWGSGTAEGTWGNWSAGVGYDVLRGKFGLALEARYLRLSNPGDAVALGARLGLRLGSPAAAPEPSPDLSTAGVVPRSAFAAGVVRSALEVMGTPYVWGGTDANGFDCSGLIQYAFRRQGVELPRTSQEQARVGVAVARDTLALVPGDILTFAQSGSRISHVGLYLGDGEFIHGASSGVRVSRLRPDDPDGRYWWRRWQGARRVVPDAAQ